jgi:hypothetical protein
MRPTRLAAVAALFVLAVGPAAAQETIDNPEFTTWSKFKKGASVTLKSTTEAGKTTVESFITTTLVEVGADKLVLETSAASKIGGMEFKTPAMKRDVPKTLTLPKVEKKDEKIEKPKTEEGTDTIKVAGTEVKAKWYKTTFEFKGTTTESKNWTSDEIPGGLVKSVTKSTGTLPSTTTMEVIEFKKP